MKQQDIAVIIIIAFMAGIFMFVISGKLITPSNDKLSAEVVTPIQSDFILPDSKVFNAEAINPTVTIEIAPTANPQPFTNQTQ